MQAFLRVTDHVQRLLVSLDKNASLTIKRTPEGEFQITARGILAIAVAFFAVTWLIS